MADTASQTTRIAAPPDRVWAIAADVEHYPDWAKDVKDVVVRARDGEGRPTEVEFRASALGRSTHYTLAYDYTQAPAVLSWSLLRGDIMRTIDGAYHFAATSDGGTEVRYDLIIDLVVPLPGFVKRRAEVRILNTVRELKGRAESGVDVALESTAAGASASGSSSMTRGRSSKSNGVPRHRAPRRSSTRWPSWPARSESLTRSVSAYRGWS